MKKLSKLFFSLFFASNFLAITLVPAVMMIIDNDAEIIQIYNAAEEEESKDEKKFEKDVVFNNHSNSNKSIHDAYIISKQGYTYLKYPKPHLNLVFPPPELS